MFWRPFDYIEEDYDDVGICDEHVEDSEETQQDKEDDASMYFDVPLPYRPIQIKRRNL